MRDKTEHLKMIQGVITRMSSNLFFLKGWAITLIIALFTLAAKTYKPEYIMYSFCIFLIFWILDGFYLSVERCYVGLFNEVRKKENQAIDFSMNYRPYKKGRNTWIRSIFSKTLLIFYGILLIAMLSMVALNSINRIDVNIDWANNHHSTCIN